MILDDKTRILLTYNSQYISINILILFLIFIFTVLLILKITKKNKYISRKTLFTLLLYHTFIALFVYRINLYGKADSRAYFHSTVLRIHSNENIFDIYGFGVKFIYSFQYPLITYLKLTYFSINMLFATLGFLGLMFLYAALAEEIKDSKKGLRYLQLSLFIPGMSYWASSIGKDAITFFGVCLVIYSIKKFKTRFLLIFIALALMAQARPYSVAIVLAALSIAIILAENIRLPLKLISIVGILVISATIVVKIFSDTYSMDNIDEAGTIIEGQQGSWGGGSDVDISNYNIVFKILTFLYRPLFIDARSIYAVLASLENLIIIYLTFSLLSMNFINYVLKNKKLLLRFNLFLFFIGVVLMSHTNANLGTAIRKKIMVMPSLISLFVLYKARKVNEQLIIPDRKTKFAKNRSK
jgi:hypothetical protein